MTTAYVVLWRDPYEPDSETEVVSVHLTRESAEQASLERGANVSRADARRVADTFYPVVEAPLVDGVIVDHRNAEPGS